MSATILLQFSKREALAFGWSKAKSNLVFFFILFVIYACFFIGLSAVQGLANTLKMPWINYLILFLNFVAYTVLGLFSFKIWLDFCEEKRPSYSDIFSVFSLYPKFALSTLIYALASFGIYLIAYVLITFGLVSVFIISSGNAFLLFIPFLLLALAFGLSILLFYLELKYQFFVYFILTLGKDVGPFEALNLSSKITRGVKSNLYWFLFLSSLILSLGASVFMIGLFLAIPTVGIAHAYIFKKLLSQVQN